MWNNKGPFIILSGPSGVGKTRFVIKSLKNFPEFANTISFTTRKPRAEEKEGEFYYFITKEEFEIKREQKELLEWAVVHSDFYATSKKEVEKLWKNKKVILKDVDVQGFHSIKKIYPHSIGIFIYPPSMRELENRILKRGFIHEEEKNQRLDSAKKEIAQAHTFDFKIVNDCFKTAWEEFKDILSGYLKDYK
ncbi:MAG: guanylate kinase [Bdellovibrionaceae bacterium]|nr:guanylate kinase [Pseudobdellovibrionaceae bacterium]